MPYAELLSRKGLLSVEAGMNHYRENTVFVHIDDPFRLFNFTSIDLVLAYSSDVLCVETWRKLQHNKEHI